MISLFDTQSVAKEFKVPFIEAKEFFTFEIDKGAHKLYVQLLKTGQYIFVSLNVDQQEYSVEHIEFYMGETKEEILLELEETLTILLKHESRHISKLKCNKMTMSLEILRDETWTLFGYPNINR